MTRAKYPPRLAVGVALALAALVTFPASSHGQLQVIISGGFSAAYGELLPQFEESSGIAVSTSRGGSVGSSPNTIPNQIRRGVPADVVILAREGLEEIIAAGRIVPGTDIDLARSMIGMVVRAGAPKPDISTLAALRQTFLNATSVAVSTSTSGRYITSELFPRLGIADEMASKTITSGASAVGRGEAEIGLQQVSEVLPIPNTDFVGTIPEEVQYVTIFSAAIVEGSAAAEGARRLIDFLSSERASEAIVRSGMEPLGRR